MVYAHSVQRVTISGTSSQGAEEWSTGFFVGSSSADAGNPTQQFADAVRNAWTTFVQTTSTNMASTFLSTEVKVAQLGTDGKTLLDNTVFSTFSPAVAGTNTTLVYPPQVSLVVTLQSALSRGLAAKGRMYLPGISYPLQTGSQISTTNADAMANNFRVFLNAVNTGAPAGSRVILASAGRGTAGTGATNQPVTRIRVGTVYDTQRRRRNSLTEQYSTAILA